MTEDRRRRSRDDQPTHGRPRPRRRGAEDRLELFEQGGTICTNQHRLTAIHEAGHVVADVVLGRYFDWAEAFSSDHDGSLGRTNHPLRDQVLWNDSIDIKDLLIDNAGGAAMFCAGASPDLASSGADNDRYYLAAKITFGLGEHADKQADAKLECAVSSAFFRRGLRLLKEHWRCVEDVAALLFERDGRVWSQEIIQLMRKNKSRCGKSCSVNSRIWSEKHRKYAERMSKLNDPNRDVPIGVLLSEGS